MCRITSRIYHCSNCNARVAEPHENLVGRSVDLCNDPNCEQIETCHTIIPRDCAACRNHLVPHNIPTAGPETHLTNGTTTYPRLQDNIQRHGIGGTTNARERSNTDPGGPSAPSGVQRSATQTSLANAAETSRPTAPMAIHGHNDSISTQASNTHSRTDSLNSNPVFYIPEGDEAGDIPRALHLRNLQREHEENERRRQREREDRESRRGSD